MGKLDGKVAIISGGARGQGAAEARLFVAEGAKVVVGDVLEAEGRALAEELGDDCAFVRLDVTDEASWETAVAEALKRYGRLDVLVNNAGIVQMCPIETIRLQQYLDVVMVNQVGVLLGMRAVLPAMRDAGGGSIVNISSNSGLVGIAGVVAYSSSKWAVRGMTKTAAIEFGPLNIRVNSVHPGGIDTEMLRDPSLEGIDKDAVYAQQPIARIGRPEEAARMVLFLASDDSSYSTGSEFVCDGGMTAGPPLPTTE